MATELTDTAVLERRPPARGARRSDRARGAQAALPGRPRGGADRRGDAVRQRDPAGGGGVLMIPDDYEERVYAGVLGKVIAVYLGRPVRGLDLRADQRASWARSPVTSTTGTDLALKNHLLVVTDDDISGTFVFPRALRDHGPEPTSAPSRRDLAQRDPGGHLGALVGRAGQLHRAHRLPAHEGRASQPPESGSIARNGIVVAEQVGAQIFVEGFAMTRPGDPEAAADLVERAARVSHDGESMHAARVVAALVAGAFVETDMDKLLDIAVGADPGGKPDPPGDRRRARVDGGRRRMDAPPGPGSTSATATTATAATATWCPTTPPSSTRWPTAAVTSSGDDGRQHLRLGHRLQRRRRRRDLRRVRRPGRPRGRPTGAGRSPTGCICPPPTAARRSPTRPARRSPWPATGRAWAGAAARPRTAPNGSTSRSPGSVQGFTVLDGDATVHNPGGRLAIDGPATVATPTFIPPEARDMPIYGLVASPTLYSGQTLRATLSGGARVPR